MTSATFAATRFQFLLYLNIIMLCASCQGPTSSLNWLFGPREPIKVLIPSGYEGPILIAYQVPDGVQAEKDEEGWVYRLQSDGALLLQNDAPRRILRISFWYVDEDGQLLRVPEDSCFEDSTAESIVVCGGGAQEIHNYRQLHPNMNYYIGYLQNYRKWGRSDDYFRLIDRYFDRLALPDQQ